MKKLAFIIIIVILIAVFIINLSLAPTARKIIKDIARKEFKLDVQFRGLSINLITGSITVSGVVVKDLSGIKQMEIKKLSSAGSYLRLLKRQVYVRSMVVDSPMLWIRIAGPKGVSIEQARKDLQGPLKTLNFIIKKAVIKNGTIKIMLDEESSGLALDIVKINAQAENIVFSQKAKDHWTKIKANGILNGQKRAKIVLSGKYNTMIPGYNFEIDSVLKNVFIPDFKDFYKDKCTFEIAKGNLVLEGKVKCRDNVLDSTCMVTITGLELKKESIPKTLFNLPSQTMIAFLKDNEGNLNYEFKISGNITDPKFSFTSNLNTSVVNIFMNTLKNGVFTFAEVVETATEMGKKAVEVGNKAAETITETIKEIGNAIPIIGQKNNKQ